MYIAQPRDGNATIEVRADVDCAVCTLEWVEKIADSMYYDMAVANPKSTNVRMLDHGSKRVVKSQAIPTHNKDYPEDPHHCVKSPYGEHRYVLWRVWDRSKPYCMFILCSGSNADAKHSDATIKRCVGFAKQLGYGAVCITTLFSYAVSTPTKFELTMYPSGPENDYWITGVAAQAKTIICAWGAKGRYKNRDKRVCDLLKAHKDKMYALHLNANGVPRHPLFLPKTNKLIRYIPKGIE